VFNVFPSRSTAPTNCCALPSQPSRRNLDGVADRGRGREGGRGRRKAPPGKKNYMFAVRRTAQAGHPDEEEERSSCFLLSFSFLSSSLTSALVPQEYFSLSLSLSLRRWALASTAAFVIDRSSLGHLSFLIA